MRRRRRRKRKNESHSGSIKCFLIKPGENSLYASLPKIKTGRGGSGTTKIRRRRKGHDNLYQNDNPILIRLSKSSLKKRMKSDCFNGSTPIKFGVRWLKKTTGLSLFFNSSTRYLYQLWICSKGGKFNKWATILSFEGETPNNEGKKIYGPAVLIRLVPPSRKSGGSKRNNKKKKDDDDDDSDEEDPNDDRRELLNPNMELLDSDGFSYQDWKKICNCVHYDESLRRYNVDGMIQYISEIAEDQDYIRSKEKESPGYIDDDYSNEDEEAKMSENYEFDDDEDFERNTVDIGEGVERGGEEEEDELQLSLTKIIETIGLDDNSAIDLEKNVLFNKYISSKRITMANFHDDEDNNHPKRNPYEDPSIVSIPSQVSHRRGLSNFNGSQRSPVSSTNNGNIHQHHLENYNKNNKNNKNNNINDQRTNKNIHRRNVSPVNSNDSKLKEMEMKYKELEQKYHKEMKSNENEVRLNEIQLRKKNKEELKQRDHRITEILRRHDSKIKGIMKGNQKLYQRVEKLTYCIRSSDFSGTRKKKVKKTIRYITMFLRTKQKNRIEKSCLSKKRAKYRQFLKDCKEIDQQATKSFNMTSQNEINQRVLTRMNGGIDVNDGFLENYQKEFSIYNN